MLLPSAPNQSGMGATASREIKYSYVFGSIFLAFMLTAPFCGLYFFAILLSLVVPIFVFSRWVIKKIGGMLGDAFGAGEQIAETVILIFFVSIFSINGSIAWIF
jgi:cobalamin synthase